MTAPAPSNLQSPALRIGVMVLLALPPAIGALVLFHFDPSSSHIYPHCLLHDWTGLYCPGCGSTRAVHAMLHLQFLTAIRFNPLAVAAAPFVGYRIGRATLLEFFPDRFPPLHAAHPRWIWLLLGFVLAFGILRNIPMRPFTCLAPPTVAVSP
jgi:hypothetical protein